MGKNIGFVSTRFAGTDGVTLEACKWSEVFKEKGINIISFDDLPDSKILELADYFGISVIESPKNFDVIDSYAENFIKIMIFRDRNHPSVISWKYLRELDPSRTINTEIITQWINSFELQNL